MEEDDKQKLLQMSEISVQLDTYEDIFSDFDPRPFGERALSDDFLLEMKKAAKVKNSGNIEVRFLIPRRMANPSHEALIKKRLKAHFKKHHEIIHHEFKSARKKAIKFIIGGAIVSMIGTYVSLLDSATANSGIENFFAKLLLVLLEPAGWFFIWDGVSRLVYIGEERRDELQFYERMSKAEFEFVAI